MWIANKPSSGTGDISSTGQYSLPQGGGIASSSGEELRGLPQYGPYGYHTKPPETVRALLLLADGSTVACGTLAPENDLLPGEVELRSGGGAWLRLCADGSIVLNGAKVTSRGQLITPT